MTEWSRAGSIPLPPVRRTTLVPMPGHAHSSVCYREQRADLNFLATSCGFSHATSPISTLTFAWLSECTFACSNKTIAATSRSSTYRTVLRVPRVDLGPENRAGICLSRPGLLRAQVLTVRLISTGRPNDQLCSYSCSDRGRPAVLLADGLLSRSAIKRRWGAEA